MAGTIPGARAVEKKLDAMREIGFDVVLEEGSRFVSPGGYVHVWDTG